MSAKKPETTQKKIASLVPESILCRKNILSLVRAANAGHTGGSLSCVDILLVLYKCIMNITPENFAREDRDHYVHSKGHSVEALYAVLLGKKFFTLERLLTIEKHNSSFIGHPSRDVPGIEQNTGALGHGLSVAAGMALAAKLDGRNNRVFTIMGDGEMAEGSIWEASSFASHYHLDNLTAIIDRNTLQITGRTEDVMHLEPLVQRLTAFGYAVRQVDGHDFQQLLDVFSRLPFEPGKPSMVIAHTIKGKGISFIEDNASWHHHVPTDEEYSVAISELDQALLSWEQIHARQ